MAKKCTQCGSALPELGGIVADGDRGELRYGGVVLGLPEAEFRLIRVLLDNPGRVVSRNALFDSMFWDRGESGEPGSKILDVMVCKIRKKLVPLGIGIATHWGRGYEMVVPALAPAPAGALTAAGEPGQITGEI